MQNAAPVGPRTVGDILTIGFATTVAMWGFGYFAHLPKQPLPSWTVFCVLAVCMFLGGGAAGRFAARGWKGGLYCGLLTGLLNLLVLGSVLGRDETGRLSATALFWVPGSIVLAMLCGTTGALLAGILPRPLGTRRPNWPAAFTIVAAVATVLLLAVGGMVTGYEAGLAVADWPNTEGYNMFLYPLAKMTGGIYFEHSHRLVGSLVGLTTLVLAVYIWRTQSRRWLAWLAVIALLMVILQGLMGGLRVTGRFTLSTAQEDMAPSRQLAIIHGVFGQVFFATLVAIATFLSATWIGGRPPTVRTSTTVDRRLGIISAAALLIQLITGATVRHIAGGVILHVALAVIVLILVATFTVRAWGLYDKEPILPRFGALLLAVIVVQLVLGLAALVVLMLQAQGQSSDSVQVPLTTLHQTVGALLLAGTTSLLLWHYRLLTPTAHVQSVTAATPPRTSETPPQ
ncbi:MAG: heme A synthase [Phycisphaerae bacterium]